jgi:hypothetical protein
MFLQIYLKKAIFLFEKTILFLKIAVIDIICKNSKMIDVNFDNIVKIFEIKKGNIKRILVNYFIQNIDYTIEQVVERGGKPRDIILLKNSSFKKLCTILNNKKAKSFCTTKMTKHKELKFNSKTEF